MFRKYQKNKNLLITILLSIFVIFFIAYLFSRFSSVIFLNHEQITFLEYLDNDFDDGVVKIKSLYPSQDWDTVCIIPAYAFSLFSKNINQELQKYFGDSYTFNIFTTPNPLSMYYGIGFSFLKNRKLIKFIKIPSAKLVFFQKDKIINLAPIHINIFQGTSRAPEKIYFEDLNISFASKDDRCFGREKAFIRYERYQHLTIGE